MKGNCFIDIVGIYDYHCLLTFFSYQSNIFESGVKHLTSNGQMMDQTFVYVVHNIKHLLVIMRELSVGLCPKNIYSFWLSHNVLSSTPRHEWGSNSQLKW
jgi:hypothetical protein